MYDIADIIDPKFRYINDQTLSWKHYVTPKDAHLWNTYGFDVKMAIHGMAQQMYYTELMTLGNFEYDDADFHA